MTKVAVLDAGTNTVRLLVASLESGRLREYARELRYVNLGQGVDSTGQFAPQAIQRAVSAIREYLPIIRDNGCTKARFVATSASRDAKNRDDFFDQVRDVLGIRVELVSGDEEAQLSFAGALSGVDAERDPVLVIDSGGGSTELVLGDLSGQINQAISLDIGSRRITERFLHHDPPTKSEITSAKDEITRQLSKVNGLSKVGTFIGVAGTVTTMAALDLGLVTYQRDLVHGSTHGLAAMCGLADRLTSISRADIAKLGSVSVERSQVIGAGALIVAEVCRRVSKDLIASETDLLDGAALSMLKGNAGQQLLF